MYKPAVLSSPGFLAVLLAVSLSSFALAAGPGDPAPPFQLPWLEGDGQRTAPDLYWESELTALVLWNRGCPRCSEIVTALPTLADSLRPLGGRVVGVAFGPDEPVSLRAWLEEHAITEPQLWDAEGTAAALYGLGTRHLGVFLIDGQGIVQAAFDDDLPGLIESVLPAAHDLMKKPPAGGAVSLSQNAGLGRQTRATPAQAGPGPGGNDSSDDRGASRAPEPALPGLASLLPGLRLDGRSRMLSSQGVKPGDLGLFGETLENGTFLLYRCDLRYIWSVAPGLQFVPWLRISNEDDAVLNEGAERLSHPRASASLIAQRGGFRGTLGAFPLRLSPLLVQRWDAQDAPPLGGVSSCGCGPGAGGLRQRSLEVLTPFFTFEGIQLAQATRWASAQTWFSLPRQERIVPQSSPWSERQLARYRCNHYGASLDLGKNSERDPEFGLPSPIGLRVALQAVEDDGRTLPADSYRPAQQDEWDWSVLTRVGPWAGFSLDGEFVSSRIKATDTPENEAAGFKAGLAGRWALRRSMPGLLHDLSLWGRAHRIRLEDGFHPAFRALTYDANREGWRFAGGLGLRGSATDKNEWIGATVFYRRVQEVDEVLYTGSGKEESSVASLGLFLRPVKDLLAEAHAVETRIEPPIKPPFAYRIQSRGLSFDLRWDGWPTVDPMLRMDAIRRETGGASARTYWQGYLSVRVVV